jgi:integrase
VAKAKGIYKRGNVYWIRYAGLDGKIRFESGGKSFKDAQGLLIHRKNEVKEGREPIPKKRIANHLFDELAEHYKAWGDGRQRGFKTKKYHIDQLEEIFGNIPLRAITTKFIEEWQTRRMSDNKPATVNRLLATLKHMFTKAVEWEMVEEETLKRVRRVKLLHENNRRLRYLSKEESKALVNACCKYPSFDLSHLRPILITALHTGMRKEEILSLEWKHVDLRHGFILLDKTKNGERREIPVNGAVKEALQSTVRRIESTYVFTDGDGRRFKDVKRSFATALKKAELERCPECNNERQKTESNEPGPCHVCGTKVVRWKGIKDFRFHDLRHTFASHLVMAGIDLTTVKELLGHKTLTMTLRYAHLAPAHKTKAVEILEGALTEKPTIQKLYSPKEKGSAYVS